MQVLPAGQLGRDGLLGVAQLAGDGAEVFAAALNAIVGLGVDALAGVVEEAEGPAVGAAERGRVSVDGFVDILEGGDERVRSG